MAVAESADAHGNHPAAASRPLTHAPSGFSIARLRPAAFAALLAVGAQFAIIPAATAQIVAYKAAPASQRPTILQAGNGVPLVNIQTPSAAGVSRNTYEQFDVQQQGVILNNSRTNTATQLGGWVQGNPWLARGSARVILNEVVSANPSQLMGYVEVAGSPAQVVIANPAGVTCSGCGFINASRATLTTGTPLMNGGNLDGYRVTGGTVRIEGTGMDASRAGYTDLIARAVEVNAGLWAQNLAVTAGANMVAADNSSATPISPAPGSGAAPAFSIDVAQLGGMYAGKITLVGTEAGVGVRNAGQIGASAGDVRVTVDGRLTNSGDMITTAAGGNVEIAAQGIDNRGKVGARHNVVIRNRGDLDNTGAIVGARELILETTGKLSNRDTGTLEAQRLDIDAGTLDNVRAAIRQTGTQALAIDTESLTNRNDGVIGRLPLTTGDNGGSNGTGGSSSGTTGSSAGSGSGNGTADSTTVIPTTPVPLADGRIAVRGAIANEGGEIVANGDTALNSRDGFTNSARVDVAQLTTRGSFGNAGGKIVAKRADIGTVRLDNSGGDIVIHERLDLAARDLDNRSGSLQFAGDTAQAIRLSGTLDNSAGKIVSGSADLTLAAATLTNARGRIGSGSSLALDIAGALDNTDGVLFATRTLDIVAASLDNRNGQIQSADALTVQTTGTVDNRQGLMRSGGSVRVGAAAIDNAGTTGAEQGIEGASLTLTAARIGNAGGAMRASGNLTVNSNGTLDNAAGLLSAGDTLGITDNSATGRQLAIDNTGGTMIADKLLDIVAASLSGKGDLLGLQDIRVKLTRDTAHTGRLIANRNASVETDGTLTNSGILEAGTALAVTAGTLDNTAAGSIKAPSLRLHATDTHTLTNRGLIDGTDTRLDAITLNNLGTGRIYGDRLSIAAGTLSNEAETVAGSTSAPVIAARSRLDLGVDSLANRDGGLIFSAGDLAVGGTLDANRRASGSATSIENTSANIEALGDILIAATSLTNQRRSLNITREVAQTPSSQYRYRCDNPPKCSYWTDITETTTDYLDQLAAGSPAAILRAGGTMQLAFSTLANRHSSIEAGGDLAMTGDTLTNEGAELYRRTDVVTSEHRWHYKNGLKDHGVFVYANSTSALAGTVPAIISAGGALTGSFTGQIDNIAIRQNTAPVSSGTGTAPANLALGGTDRSGATLLGIGRVAAGNGQSVVSISPSLTLPANRLYRQTSNPTARYLIETDPAFASYRQWISSDYMLQQLALDPATTQKRLGDGFYEQRLITEQVAQLTGRRFLAGHASDEAQYQALMNAGVAFAKEWHLIPGVALSAEQMARLTTDIVWLVEKEVAGQKVLVPQLYARVQDGDLAPSGALLAGASVDLDTATELINSGRIAGRQVVSLTAENIRNLGDVSGREILADAKQDLQLKGGRITAENRLEAKAGRDLTVESSTVDLDYRVPGENARVRRTDISRVAGLYVTGDGGTLIASAGQDLHLLAAAIGSAGSATLAAGNNLTLGTVTETRDAATSTKKTRWRESASTEVGSSIQTGGDLTLIAGQDLTARAATAQSDGAIAASAGRDLTIESGEANAAADYTRKSSSGGLFSKKRSTTHNASESTTAIASTFSGDSVTLVADRDIAVKGSNVVATNDTTLAASRNLSIEAATETHSETHTSKTKQSGVFSSGGVGFTVGSRQNSSKQTTETTTAAKSTIGSTDGNVKLLAGEQYKQVGSDVIAVKGDIDIAARQVDIVEARETSRTTIEQKSKQSGLTVAITSPVITAVQTAQQMREAAKDTSDPRMKALAAASTGLAGYNAANAIADTGSVTGGANLTISIGGSKSSSQATQTSDTAAGSNLTAGRDITITASGAGEQSDLTIRGSNARAGGNVTLSAEDEIRLLAAKNTADQQSTNKSSSASVGISLGTNTGFTVGGSAGRGKADGNDLAYTNTRVEAGETLTLQSGGDTTLRGAVARGEKVKADIGGDLRIESLQDTSTYDSRQKSLGGSVTIGTGGVTGSVSASGSKVKSDYASVTEQSAIRAGDGGFDVKVGNDTDLKGGAITSTQKAIDEQLNRFETEGKLTLSDIENKAAYEAKGSSVSLGAGTSFDGKLTPGGSSAGFGKDSGSASSMTLAAISGIAGNTEARTGDKETGIGKIFDQQKVEKEIAAQVKITQAFNEHAPRAAATYSANQVADLKRQAELETDPARKAELQDEAKKWGPNGSYTVAMNIIIGAAGGNLESAVAKESLSWAANEMRQAMIEDSKKFKGLCDTQGNCISNMSGESVGVNGDEKKIAGGRIVLSDWCADGRCTEAPADARTKSGYVENPDGTVIFTPKDKDGNAISLSQFIAQHDDWRSPLGGHQGGAGQMSLFGIQLNYAKGEFLDKLAEAYAGTHDTLNSVIWYDELGNSKNLKGFIERIGTTTNMTNVGLATPFALSVLLPPEVWNAILMLNKLR